MDQKMLWSIYDIYTPQNDDIVKYCPSIIGFYYSEKPNSSYCFSVSGGMVMDPFRSGGMGSMGGGMFRPPRNPGQLPRLVFFNLKLLQNLFSFIASVILIH